VIYGIVLFFSVENNCSKMAFNINYVNFLALILFEIPTIVTIGLMGSCLVCCLPCICMAIFSPEF
jgi:hypothetical protein